MTKREYITAWSRYRDSWAGSRYLCARHFLHLSNNIQETA